MTNLKFKTLTALITLTLGACATAPTVPVSSLPSEADGQLVSAATAGVSDQTAPKDWWRLYNSPELDSLVASALANNRSLAVAAANLEQVRAGLTEARSALLPSTTASAGGQYVRDPALAPWSPCRRP